MIKNQLARINMSSDPRPVLNNIKKKVSEAYLYAVVAKADFAIQKLHDEYDSLGFDYQVTNRRLGTKRTVFSESSEIKIQLKGVAQSSSSMLQDKDDCIKYNLDSPVVAIGPNCFLIVVNLLDDEKIDKWVEINDEELVLRKCAYFIKVPTSGFQPGFIKIPKTNKLTIDTLKTLFISNNDKDQI